MTLRSVIPSLWRNVFWLLSLVACDSLRGDFIEPDNQITFSQIEYYILPGSSTVIDLKTAIEQAFTSLSVTISSNPGKGTLTQIDPFLLKYTPDASFVHGTDQFAFAAILDNGTPVKNQTITIFLKERTSDFPCDIYANEDFVRVKSNTSTAIHPLKNDRICGIEGAMNIFIHIEPKSGNAVVEGDSIIYTPSLDFTGSDELVYQLSSDGGEDVTYGIVSFNRKKIETFLIPIGYNDIFFVNDTVGFIAGRDILKTIDGGRHWTMLSFPTGERDVINIEEIFFLDENNGFAAFSSCYWIDDCLGGGWMVTRNGGVSWERVKLDHPVFSIFFLSPLKGFMSSTRVDPWDLARVHSILKTVDGGETWDEVATYRTSFGNLKISFGNDQLGYAYHSSDVFATINGGDSWNHLAKSNYITSLALTSNVMCASFGSSYSVASPSTIVRSENAETWTNETNFPYAILAQEFSPSGDLAVAVGISATNPSIDPVPQLLTISTSNDKGKTWTDVPEESLYGFPRAMSVPSSNVAYILCLDRIIRFTP